MQQVNPYFQAGFGEFFIILAQRIGKLLTGQLGFSDLVSDEIQLLVLIFITLSCACIGTFLVLKKMTMLANSLSHTILLGIVIAFLIGKSAFGVHTMDMKTLCIAALSTGLFTTVCTQMLHKGFKLQEDASIGLTFTTLFALGVVLVSIFTRNTHLGVEAIMGNIDALHFKDLKLVFFLFLFNLFLTIIFFKPLAVSTFDPILGASFGIPLFFISYLLMVQTAASAIGAFRALGAFLFLALLVAPVLTARFFTHDLKKMIYLASLIGIGASLLAVALSRHLLSVYELSLSTAGLVTLLLGMFFLFGLLKRTLRSVKI